MTGGGPPAPGTVRLIGTDQQAEWKDVLAVLPHSYWHTWSACRAIEATIGGPVRLFSYTDDTGARAACPFAERRWHGEPDIYSPIGFSGFVCSSSVHGLADVWRAFASAQGYVCGYFALHPVLAHAGLHAPTVETNELLVLDLGAGVEGVARRADRSVRRAVRDWERQGRAYVTDRARLRDFARTHYGAFMARMGARPQTVWSAATLDLMLEDPSVLVVGAEDEEGVCALHSFASTTHGGETHLNISARDGRDATTALVWWGIGELARRGVPWLNLGGGVVRGDAIAQAKLKFRPRCVPLLTAREVYRPTRFAQLCEQAGVAPDQGGFFPPYRQG